MTGGARERNGGSRALLRSTGLILTLFLLAGCAGNRVYENTTDTFKGLYQGILGLGGNEEEENTRNTVEAEPPPPDIQCPKAIILPGTAAHVIYAGGTDPHPRNVQYQGSLTSTARECDFSNPAVHIKFGFSGRVLLGPRGTVGLVTLPVRASLIKRDDSVAWTQLYQIPVQISNNSRAEHFVKIEDGLDYEVPPGENIYEYRIIVGFEQEEQ